MKTKKITIPELLAPAGNMEKLIFAVSYDADAVYFGTEFGSLRAYAGNFTLDEAGKAIGYLHENGKKGYAALNIYPFSDEYDRLVETAGALAEAGADALIIADIGLMREIRKAGIKTPIHVSTQANTTSAQTVLAYAELGAARVNLARELSCEQITQIQQQIAGNGIETEVFIHGAVCFSYSGRCAISDYMTGRGANRGECTHPCRWAYYLVEEQRPGEYLPVFEDERGQYMFNNKDLALFDFVPALTEAGVNSFKIEGRMKSIHYVASVVSLYRQIIDGATISQERAFELLSRVKNRGYSTGFMKGDITPNDYSGQRNDSESKAVFVGNITEGKDEKSDSGFCVCEIRNKILAGDELEVLKPNGSLSTVIIDLPIMTIKGQPKEFVNNSQFIRIKDDLPKFSILRRVEK
ncbi:MAG: U32 family peptidase [Anaerohalosphaeraceae bacterium]|nr:U32 family peptidase [Anaerohalosphaeraceae bacterium]